MYSDAELIDGIRRRDNKILQFIYQEYYPSIQFLINSNHGGDEAARDLFQDVIIVLFTKIQNDELILSCTLKTFVCAIGKNLWLKQLSARRQWKMQPLDIKISSTDDNLDEIEIISAEDIKSMLYQKHFLRLSFICQQILKLVVKKVSFKEIAKQLKLKNEQYARKRKYRCLQTLIINIKDDPIYKSYMKNDT